MASARRFLSTDRPTLYSIYSLPLPSKRPLRRRSSKLRHSLAKRSRWRTPYLLRNTIMVRATYIGGVPFGRSRLATRATVTPGVTGQMQTL